MSYDCEVIVIGAGVVGLAVGRALALAGKDVLVLERQGRIGAETSSRNSEVVHAGIYYPPGSLRAKCCVKGKRALYRFCAESGVTAKPCGKLLVATSEDELARLKAFMERGKANGVDDLVWLGAADAKRLEPELSCVGACLSPSTGVVDSHAFMQALEGSLEAASGQVVLQSRVIGAALQAGGNFRLEVESAGTQISLTSRYLVNAAGLGASALGRMIGGSKDCKVPETYPAKGHYFQLKGKAPFRRLIYPMPSGAWLGIHLTLDWSGKVKFGPDLQWIAQDGKGGSEDSIDYSFDDPDGRRRMIFEREIRRYWPSLPDNALLPDYTGIRPKVYREGEAPADFLIHGPESHGIERLVSLYGIESPGLTSSLAIGDEVVARLP